MTNILFYTQLHTYDESSLFATYLLEKSLKYSLGNVNFKIVIKEDDYDKYPPAIRHKLIRSSYNKKYLYAGDLKYSQGIINESYDRYVYLDADILYLLKNNKFEKNQYCGENSQDFPWFYYGYEFFEDSLNFFNNLDNLDSKLRANAGFFSIDKMNYINLSNFFSSRFNQREIPNLLDQMMFEQSIFNMFIDLNPNIFTENIMNNAILHANGDFHGNKLYHFCGVWRNFDEKAEAMKNFLINNNLKGILDSAD